jgi:hypothetical protein
MRVVIRRYRPSLGRATLGTPPGTTTTTTADPQDRGPPDRSIEMTTLLATAITIAVIGVALGPLTACLAFTLALFIAAVDRLDPPEDVWDGFAPSY